MSARKARSAVPLTEARKQLFQLVEELLTGRRDRVVLSHREHDEQVVLLRAGEVARMEAELAALRRRNAVSEPRPLWGIATFEGDVEEFLAESRAEARRRAEAKMRAICGDDPAPEASAEPQAPRTGARRRGPRARKSTP